MTFIPEKHDFLLWRGGTFRTRLTLFADSTGTVPYDLTGYTANLIIRDKPEGTAVTTLTTENGGITLGGTTGTIDLFISDEATASLTWKVGHYDLLITSSSGDTHPLLYGKFQTRGV